MTSVFPAASAPADVLPSVPVRGVRAPELPSSLVFAHSDAAVADALAQTLAELELRRPLFALGRAGRNLLGRSLVIDCGAQLECATVETAGATLDEVDRLQHVALEEKADVIISCGGGQTLDVGKYGATRALLPFFAIPTQASHDGICSPVAVLRGADGRVSSYGARAPAALFVPVHVVSRAPRRTLVSGMADLAANLIAVEDWRWAGWRWRLRGRVARVVVPNTSSATPSTRSGSARGLTASRSASDPSWRAGSTAAS